MYSLSDYHYHLPEERIAQKPAQERDQSRLLVLDRNSADLSHCVFSELPQFLHPEDLLIINDTRVIPGRLYGKKESGGKVEILVLADGNPGSDGCVERPCLIKASKRPRKGTRLYFDSGLTGETLGFEDGIHRVRFFCDGDFDALLARIGHMPLPPYIRRTPEGDAPCDDHHSYQTVYAEKAGAVAAPTAGLHFTPSLLEEIRSKDVDIARLTLHVGYGTFVPVRVEDIREHRMHSEWFSVSRETAKRVNETKARGGRVIAVGTTSVRTLEYATDENSLLTEKTGNCDLFIYPGYRFKAVDAMITNFHLPESTLLMLVSAFAGRGRILSAYRTAVESAYRFYSYGDAMLIL